MTSKPKTNRREFIRTSTGVAVALTAHQSIGFNVNAACSQNSSFNQEKTADQLIQGKDKRLEVLKPDPAVLQTPLKLMAGTDLTPASLLFVRNNQQPKEMANLAAVQLKGWQLEIGGASNKALTIDASTLTSLPQKSVRMVLQCSGNGRSLFSETAQTSGTQWGRGGFGCVEFSGVPVSAVMEKLGIEPEKSARYVKAEGADNPSGKDEDFLHSLPVDEFMNRSMLVVGMNGKPLPAIHGGPLRLVTPGVFATMHLKWLSKLTFEKSETENFNHRIRYRVPKKIIKPGAEFDFRFANSNYNWNMKVKTILLTPTTGDKVAAGKVSVKGIAFNDGSTPIETVLVSVDRGMSWTKSKLEKPESLFAWTKFSTELTLKPGPHEIWTRAVDKWGRSQPLDGSIVWNPRGYEWNGVEQIAIEAV